MNKRKLTNMAASVKARLLQLSKDRGEAYDFTLAAFVGERFLYRLSRSPYANRFILKGAFLLNILFGRRGYRTTRDIDVLDADPESADDLQKTLAAIVTENVSQDGIDFQPDSITVEEIRAQNIYHGLRARVDAYLERTRITLQIDCGFGDSVEPSARIIECPSLLDFETPQLLAYPMEAAVAEKLHAMVSLGTQTSRMKDYFDLNAILQTFSLPGKSVYQAIGATFSQRRTPIPRSTPEALDEALPGDPTKQKQWAAFLRKIEVDATALELNQVVHVIRSFSDEMWKLLNDHDFERANSLTWSPSKGWHSR